MDPITAAIVAAVTAGLAAGVTDIGKKAIVDAYNALKGLLEKKFGDKSDLVQAVGDLEQEPASEGRKIVLGEKVKQTGADKDQEVIAAANTLLEKLKAQPGMEKHVQQVIGSSYVAQADGGSTATVTIGKPEK